MTLRRPNTSDWSNSGVVERRVVGWYLLSVQVTKEQIGAALLVQDATEFSCSALAARLESSGDVSNAPVLAMPGNDPRTMPQLPGLASRLAGQSFVLLVLFW